MQSRAVFLFGVLFCVVCATISVSAGKGKGKGGGFMKGMMKKCGDGEINIEEAFKGKKECFEEAKSKKEEGGSRRRRSPDEGGEEGGHKGKKGKGKWGKMGRNACMKVCMWKKSGMLDESGKFSESGAKAYVDKVYPESKRTDAMAGIKACADESSSKFSMDNKCAGYNDFKKCVFKAHMKTCGISWGKGGGKGGKGGDKQNAGGAEGAGGEEE